MKYYELKVNVRLKKDIHFKDAIMTLNFILNRYMTQSDFLKAIHLQKGYKYYNYSSFYPVDEDIHYEGEEYFFTIRSCRKRIITEFDAMLKNENPIFYCLDTNLNIISKHNLYGLYTYTPMVMTYPNYAKYDGYWLPEHPIQDFTRAINSNLIKKYYTYTGTQYNQNHNIIESIELINNPVGIKYREGFIIGNKCKIILKQDKVSQQLAFFGLGVGLLEKNALGFGYCNKLKIEG